MSVLLAISFWCSIFLIATGTIALVFAWLAPTLLDPPFLRWMITGKRLAPTRANRTLMASWAVLMGCYLLLSSLGYRTLSLIAVAVCLAVGVVVLRRLHAAAIED